MEMIILKPKFSKLYTKTNYLAPIDVVSNKIIEYDMQAAGFSVIKEYKLLSEKKIAMLESMVKEERNVLIGKMRGEKPELTKGIKGGITRARKDLFQSNFIKDEDVLSIKNDAIFIIGRKLKTLDFGKIHFVEKNVYNLYYNINGIEFYHDKANDRIDVKGISDDVVKDHDDYMVSFLKKVFTYIEYDRMEKLKQYLIEFSMKYKELKLDPGFYKEFNHNNMYRYKQSINDYYMHMVDVSKEDLVDIDISYNYLFYVLPILNQYIF